MWQDSYDTKPVLSANVPVGIGAVIISVYMTTVALIVLAAVGIDFQNI